MEKSSNNFPLDTIRRKERELAQKLKEAENKANEKLAVARERAAQILKEAESAAQHEAEQFFHEGMLQAKDTAAAINDRSAREAEDLIRKGETRLDRAAQIVIDSIFPK